MSSSENKDNLTTQADRVSAFCAVNGWVVSEVVKECGSGLNDTRPKLMSLPTDVSVARIVVEHKDRLTWFGFNYIEQLSGKEIVVINKTTGGDVDLMADFVSLVTSFAARLYGYRRTKHHTESLIEALKKGGSIETETNNQIDEDEPQVRESSQTSEP